MEIFKETFGSGGEKVQVGFADVLRVLEDDSYGADGDYDFDPERLEKLTALSVETDTPVAFYLQAGGLGVKSPPEEGSLTEMLLENFENRMWYADNSPVEEWTDGVDEFINLTLNNEGEVGYYREKNIKQVAVLLREFWEAHPDLFGGVSVSQEVGFAFPDEEHGWTGYEPAMVGAFQEEYGVEPPRVEGGPLWNEWIQFRQEMVDRYVQQEVNWVHSVGIPDNLIYTQQVLPNWGEGRQITGNTWEAAEVDNGVMGLSIYMYGDWFKAADLEEAYDAHGEPGWGAMCLSPDDYNDYGLASEMLWDAYDNGAGFIGPYGWFPDGEITYDMLGALAMNGKPYQDAVVDFIEDLRE